MERIRPGSGEPSRAEALAKEDDEFARQFTELQQAVQTGQDGIHRKWTPADAQIIRAWVEHRFDLPIESWRGFQSRILGAASTLSPGAAKVAVFTSATPIGIWAGRAWVLTRLASSGWQGAIQHCPLAVFPERGGGPALLLQRDPSSGARRTNLTVNRFPSRCHNSSHDSLAPSLSRNLRRSAHPRAGQTAPCGPDRRWLVGHEHSDDRPRVRRMHLCRALRCR